MEQSNGIEDKLKAKTKKPAHPQSENDRHESRLDVIPQERHDLRILQSLRRIVRAIDLHSRKLTMRYNITTPQLVCLMAIMENKTMTVAAIAKEIHLSASTVVGILDRLEEKKLIVRKRDTKDRRVVKVSATPAGGEFVLNAPSPLQDKLVSSLSTLSDLEQATILHSLERIVELMEAETIDAGPFLDTGQIGKSGN